MIIIVLVVGILLFCGFYLLLQGTLVRSVLGISFLGHAANVIIFSLTGLKSGQSAILDPTKTNYVDPLPQALILTAIVIGFGLSVYFLILSYKVHQATGNDQVETVEEITP